MNWKWMPSKFPGIWIRNFNAVPMLPDERERMMIGHRKWQEAEAWRLNDEYTSPA